MAGTKEHQEVGRVVAGAVKANRLGQLRDVAQRLGRDACVCPGEATITAILPNAHDPVGRRDELFEVGDLLAPVVRRDAAAVAVVAAPAGSDEVRGLPEQVRRLELGIRWWTVVAEPMQRGPSIWQTWP